MNTARATGSTSRPGGAVAATDTCRLSARPLRWSVPADRAEQAHRGPETSAAENARTRARFDPTAEEER